MRNRIARSLTLLAFFSFAVASAARAQPTPAPPWVPEPWAPWIPWVLYDAGERACAFLDGDPSSRRCEWPGRLALSLNATGGRFEQTARVEVERLFPLPGEPRQWPTALTVNGRPAAVLGREERPFVLLPMGTHKLEGRFVWPRLPEVLRVPATTGVLALEVEAKAVDFPNRDAEGRVWLRQGEVDPAAAAAQDTLEVTVHRRMDDDVPFLLETRIDLQVSGRGREIVVGPVLPPGFVLHHFAPPLPARLEPDGRLRVQVRPGTFCLEMFARHEGPVTAIVVPGPVADAAGQMPWTEEIWTLTAHGDLRQVEVTGAVSVDPSQTRLPDAWRSLPAWLVRPGETLTLTEQRRGDPKPPPDRLTLSRDLWLDASGQGFTLRDQLGGTLANAWRLDMPTPVALGRVAVGGRDLLITQGASAGRAGVELREGTLALVADSRLEGALRTLPAVGWDQDFESVSAQLHLPPGWRLFDASGADDVPGTWLRAWSLLDLFLLLVSVLAVAHLFGRVWGLVALLALALAFPESGAPRTIWLAVLAGQALLRVLPEGRARRFARLYFWGAALVLIGITLPFLVTQVRMATYPVLEHPWARIGDGQGDVVDGNQDEGGGFMLGGMAKRSAPARAEMAPAAPPGEAFDEPNVVQSQSANLEQMKGGDSFYGRENAVAKRKRLQVEVDPQAAVQTGPGLPRWTWNTHTLVWSGPVQRDQTLSLTLISPSVTFAVGWLRAALVGLLAVCVLGLLKRRGAVPSAPSGPSVPSTPAVAALVLGLFVLGGARTASADLPPPDSLTTLRERLLADPACAPSCADIESLSLNAQGDRLLLELDVGAAAETAVRLPGGPGSFVPDRVSVDGAPGLVLRDGDTLWVRLGVGRHRVRVEGPLTRRDTVEIPLAQRPRRVSAALTGYSLAGLDEFGLPQDTLQLVRSADSVREAGAGGAEPAPLPAYGRVERTVSLGLQWTAETRVVRASPPGAPLVLQVPLLPGESVTTAEVEVKDGRAMVTLGPGATKVIWTSVLAPSESLALTATQGQPFTEVWRVDASPVWHVEFEGIPVVRRTDDGGARRPEWRPWPGEKVTLSVRRPPPLDGSTLTIDHADLSIQPGRRATDHTLVVELRTSRGGPWGFELPPGARVHRVQLAGVEQPVTAGRTRVEVPLSPGSQTLTVDWQTDAAVGLNTVTPAVDLGLPAVNVDVTVAVPADRWLLLTGGPQYGPAILFWSLLAMVVAVAFGLGRSTLTPLGFGSWLALGLGLAQTFLPSALFVVGWLFALGLRARRPATGRWTFNLGQLALVGLTLIAFGVLLVSIQHGLLGLPEMQVQGNGSHDRLLRFFSDRTEGPLPSVWFVSVPLAVYRGLMLLWALWLAKAVLGWVRWSWRAFTHEGYWRGRPGEAVAPEPAPALDENIQPGG
jgi:hypothetical protein